MHNLFDVDVEKRKSLIKQMRKLQMPKMFFGVFVYKILYALVAILFIVPTICAIVKIVDCISMGDVDEISLYLGIILVTFCICAFATLIPYSIQYCIEKNYLQKWSARTSETVRLQNKSILWGHYDRFMGKSYWEYQILYSDIQSLIYDRKEQILYIYGYMSGKEWESINHGRCIDTIEINRTITPIPWMTLPAYFNNFVELKSSLSKVTGKIIEER